METQQSQIFKALEDLADNKNNTVAQYEIGHQYEFGTPRNMQRALCYYEKAAEQGNADAQCSLGRCYRQATGMDRNMTQACYYLQMSVNQGHVEAMYQLSQCYAFGVMLDTARYDMLLTMAAHKGHIGAKYDRCLNRLYRTLWVFVACLIIFKTMS